MNKANTIHTGNKALMRAKTDSAKRHSLAKRIASVIFRSVFVKYYHEIQNRYSIFAMF